MCSYVHTELLFACVGKAAATLKNCIVTYWFIFPLLVIACKIFWFSYPVIPIFSESNALLFVG
jgi:hypothetical protein